MTRIVITLVHAPELADLIFFEKERVARVFGSGFIEWYVFCPHEEEHYATSEEISLERLVTLIAPEFRSHILGCSKTCCGKALLSCATKRAGKAEVSKLDIVILIKKAVLWL